MSTKPARAAGFYPRLGVSSPFDAHHDFVTSPVFSPLVLAILRLTLARYFSYFTHLSYIGLIAYLYAAGVQTLYFALKGKSGYPLQRWPRPLQLLHSLLYSTVTTYPLVVTVIYWALLSSAATFETSYSAFLNISVHALNTVIALVEVTLTNAPPQPWLHLPICVFMLACYLGVAYITYATQGFYTYSFLDPGKQRAKLAGYIIAVGVAECLAFVLVRGLTWARNRLSKRNLAPAPDSTESIAERQPSEDWEQIERPSSSIARAV